MNFLHTNYVICKYCYISSFPIFIPFPSFLFIALAWASSMTLNVSIGSRFPCFALLKNPASMLSVGYLKMLFIRLIKGNFLLYHFCWEFLWICTLLIFCIPSNIWKNSPVKMFRSRAFLVGKFIIKHLFFLTELLKFYIFSHVILVSYIFRGIFHYLKLSNLLV